MEQAPGSQFGVSRIVAAALPTGVVLFWVVGWILTRPEGGLAPEALSPDLALILWAAVAMGGFAAALAFRARALEATRALRRSSSGLSGVSGAATVAPAVARGVQTNLVIAWALLEAPALLSGVLLLLTGATQILLLAVPLYLVGVALTFPRREWFGETPGRRRSTRAQRGP